MNDMLRERHALYEKGLGDGEIGRLQGVDRSAIRAWRKRRALKANTASQESRVDIMPMRRLLHDLGWGAWSIARSQGVSTTSVKEWRNKRGLKAAGVGRLTTKEGGARQLRELQQRVVRAVGCRLPFDIAADAAAELMLAVIEGTVPLDEIEKQGRSFGKRALQEYANAFTTKSLDEDVPDHDGLRPIDMLVDEASAGWLEEMGATVH